MTWVRTHIGILAIQASIEVWAGKCVDLDLGANLFCRSQASEAGCETRVFKDTSCEDPASVSLQNPDGVRWPDSSSPQVPGSNRQ